MVTGFTFASQVVGPRSSLAFNGGLFAFQPPGLSFYGIGPEDSSVTNGLGS